MNKSAILMTPGPVPVSQAVLDQLAKPVIHHRTPAFVELYKDIKKDLKNVFRTSHPVLPLASTGTGAMEAALVNICSPGDNIIVVCAGKFGERWADMAEAFGINVQRVTCPWGESVDLKELESMIGQTKNLKALCVQACETSTGTWHPVEEMASLLDSQQTLFVVDGITAVGASSLAMDDYGIDVLIAGSQKALALPTGMSFVALSERAWRAYSNAKCPRYYFDLGPELEAYHKNQTRFSSPVSLFFSLHQALVERRGREEDIIRKTQTMAEIWRRTTELFGLKLLSQNPSPSLTAIVVPEPVSGADLQKLLEEDFGVTFMGGQEHLKGKILRVGHMGAISEANVLYAIEALFKALNQSRFKVEELALFDAIKFAKSSFAK